MIEEVKKYEESYNQIYQKYPSSFRDFSDKKLKDFDETQTGTIKELTEKKKNIRNNLKQSIKNCRKSNVLNIMPLKRNSVKRYISNLTQRISLMDVRFLTTFSPLHTTEGIPVVCKKLSQNLMRLTVISMNL